MFHEDNGMMGQFVVVEPGEHATGAGSGHGGGGPGMPGISGIRGRGRRPASRARPAGSRRVNRAFAQMLGRSVEDLVGASFGEITSLDDLTYSREVMRDLANGQVATARFDKCYVRPDRSLV